MSMLYFRCCSVRLAKLFLALRMTNTPSYFSEVKIEVEMMLCKNIQVQLYSLIKDGKKLM